MKNIFLILVLTGIYCDSIAQFAPPAGQMGTTAIYKDSSAFVAWATGCTVTRGYQDISNPAPGYASAGDSSMALGKAGSGTVSLGDGGYAVVTFAKPIMNGPGRDFAVFENGFDNTFLELAFVEVSSDGINFFRFPATSNTQTATQIDGFGSVDATKINNLAGKYRANYGTPFDLEELAGQSGLDVNNITHVKIIDVVGCIQDTYATHDQYGNKINDPWKTPFPSSGFDLDAVGVINEAEQTGMKNNFSVASNLNVYPNPVIDKLTVGFYLEKNSDVQISMADVTGRIVYQELKENKLQGRQAVILPNLNLADGIYFLRLETDNGMAVRKIIVSNE